MAAASNKVLLVIALLAAVLVALLMFDHHAEPRSLVDNTVGETETHSEQTIEESVTKQISVSSQQELIDEVSSLVDSQLG